MGTDITCGNIHILERKRNGGQETEMKIELDWTVILIMVIFFIPGWALITYFTNTWVALGVFFMVAGATVRRERIRGVK